MSEGGLALYDLSSSYFEGQCCPLAKIGYSRDGKRNTSQVNYGLLTTSAGCPVAISVYEGNTADASTLMPQVKQLREQFGLERLVLIGDRGMISHKAIDTLRSLEGLAWITALKSSQIRALAQGGTCMLAYYVEWHMREAWRELMFADEHLERKKYRDPVAAAERSEAALEKIASRTLKDGSPLHSFRTLLAELSTIVRNTCEARVGKNRGSTFQMTTTPNPAQHRALERLQAIAV